MMKPSVELLRFCGEGVGGRDVYNPTTPFDDGGVLTLAARVESRDSETDSEAMFFRETEGVWERIHGSPAFPLQDPLIARIHGELLFGGVRFPVENNSWKTVFYRGATVNELKPFAQGPLTMKDIRLLELDDGRIGVFTRPMGEIGGRGKIGFMTIDSLDELPEADLVHAPLIDGQFGDETWGGVNEARMIAPGRVGVIGHIAEFGRDGAGIITKHYRAMAFEWDLSTQQATPLRQIAKRKDFPETQVKRDPELIDVVIPGGLIPRDGGQAELYCGLSDAACARIFLPDPFERSREPGAT